MGKFYRYTPITLKELKDILLTVKLPEEINSEPTIHEYNNHFVIKYLFVAINPFSKMIPIDDVIIVMRKRWMGMIRVACKNEEALRYLKPYFSYHYRVGFKLWDKKPIAHSNLKDDLARYCGICYTPGRYAGNVCKNCTTIKKAIGRKRVLIPNYKAHVRLIQKEIDRLNRNLIIMNTLKISPDTSDSEIARRLVQGVL